MNTLLIILGIFSSAKAWIVATASGAAIGIVAKVAQKKGWTLKLDALAKIVSKYSKKVSSLLRKSADATDEITETADAVDDSIDDVTGEFNKNKKDEIVKEAKDIIESGEKVVDSVKSFKQDQK